MRHLLIISGILFSSTLSFSKGIDFAGSYYEIVSDHANDSIEEGYFLICGVVKDNTAKAHIPYATVTNMGLTHQSVSDAHGKFSLKLPVADSVIYCYAADHGGVQIKGPFKSKHVIQVRVFLHEQQMVVFKPVIYAYNASQIIHLSLKPHGHFTFTYPDTKTGEWTVKTNADGTFTNLADGKKYPYLFWEAEQTMWQIPVDHHKATGFLIQTDTCISFLEKTLSAFGLNEKESTDFITFWGPKMIEKPFAFIQFSATEDYGRNIAEINIDPKPETLLRLYMYLMPLDKKELPFEVVSPAIQPLSRRGFTVIEWGGSVLPQAQLNHL